MPMLKNAAFHVPSWPAIVIYPDDADATLFYGCAERPRVARERSGEPAVSLMVFGRRGPGPLVASGGQFTITVNLQVSEHEQRGIEAALGGRLIYPDWIESEVTLQRPPDLSLTGAPSMMGANECVLSATLEPSQASRLARDWPRVLQDATLRYRVTMRSAATEVLETRTHTEAGPAKATRATDSTLEATARTAGPLKAVLEGPPGLDASDLTGRLQVVHY